jgi:hypothetical protein
MLFLWESCGLPSIEMWVDRGEVWCCVLSKVGIVETVGIHQVMWLVMLEYTNDRILGVDTLGQKVSPCVWYGTACWLIRKALLNCLVGCAGLVWRYLQGCKVQERPKGIVLYPIRETVANAKGAWGYCVISNKGKPMAKQDIRSRVDLSKGI